MAAYGPRSLWLARASPSRSGWPAPSLFDSGPCQNRSPKTLVRSAKGTQGGGEVPNCGHGLGHHAFSTTRLPRRPSHLFCAIAGFCSPSSSPACVGVGEISERGRKGAPLFCGPQDERCPSAHAKSEGGEDEAPGCPQRRRRGWRRRQEQRQGAPRGAPLVALVVDRHTPAR